MPSKPPAGTVTVPIPAHAFPCTLRGRSQPTGSVAATLAGAATATSCPGRRATSALTSTHAAHEFTRLKLPALGHRGLEGREVMLA